MKFVNKWATLTPEELEKILDEAFKTVAERLCVSGRAKLMTYDDRHGGPYDRGSADFWYGRPFEPHYFVKDTDTSDKVELADMSAEEITAYTAGFRDAEERGDQKDWGDASC